MEIVSNLGSVNMLPPSPDFYISDLERRLTGTK